MLLTFHGRLGSLCLFVAALARYAWINAGIHHPGDVAAGAAIALAAALIFLLWCDTIMLTARRRANRAIAAIRLPLLLEHRVARSVQRDDSDEPPGIPRGRALENGGSAVW